MIKVSLSPDPDPDLDSNLDSRSDSKRRRRGRPARARVRSSESAPGGDGDRASPHSPASGGDDADEYTRDARISQCDSRPPLPPPGSDEYDDKTVKTEKTEAFLRRARADLSRSGDDDEGAKRDASPLPARPASGGRSSGQSFWSGAVPPAVQSKSKGSGYGSKGADKGKWKGKGSFKGKPKQLPSASNHPLPALPCASIHPTARYSQQHSERPSCSLVPRDLAKELANWKAFPSEHLVHPFNAGLEAFANRSNQILSQGKFSRHLFSQLPEDPSAEAWRREGWDVPATGSVVNQDSKVWGPAWDSTDADADAARFIKELCNRHRGEVREVWGEWSEYDDPLPAQFLNTQFEGSMVRVSGRLAMPGNLVAGCRGRRGELQIRHAKVFALADLFLEFGDRFTAAELYEYYQSCRVVATRRTRSQQGYKKVWDQQ